ncbi:MAG: tetratricopeptide repeat protein [Ruminococcaceae bacterium]|nr:tetratricopeptide repeat protein [Oscillospiraceae bacterium]
MAIFKCKMCGGDLNIEADVNVVECEYCGTTQTVPALDSEKKVNLFNRANRLRLNSEFDKAAGIYENIIAEFPEEAEAYWGLCLCNYGIEYVDDPATAKKIPTCHRASFEKLSSDENFKMAMEYADVVAQKIYRDEAREIDRIMDEILSISKNEKPYDVFICYKETDDKGERTIDSVLAQDIYDSLTAKGMKVFFARITLEDKLGQMYEPYIFAALNSAKVLLSVGTKYEYFHAVWVKNEWSRFLKLMAKDKSKVLIPCYKDMDAYDMPDEFKALQAQDMGKIGFMQDLVRGIEKIIGVVASGGNSVAETKNTSGALTTRGYFYLEDKEYEKANEYFEKALDENPLDAMAYVGKTLLRLRLSSLDELENIIVDLDADKDFMRAIRVAEGEEKNHLESIKEKADKRKLIFGFSRQCEQIEKKYENATSFIRKADKEKKDPFYIQYAAKTYERARNLFESLGGYLDSEELAKECKEKFDDMPKEKIRFEAENKMNQTELSQYFEAKELLEKISGWKDADELLLRCEQLIEERQAIIESKKEENAQLIKAVNTAKKLFSCYGNKRLIAVKVDGTVLATGENAQDEACHVEKWRDIIEVSTNEYHTVGLQSDGRVVSTNVNDKDNDYSQNDVSEWKNIISIATTKYHTMGLMSNGKVVVTHDKKMDRDMSFYQPCVETWENIVQISSGDYFFAALSADGKVYTAASANRTWQIQPVKFNLIDYLYQWCPKNIKSIFALPDALACLTKEGRVVVKGKYSTYDDFKKWDDIIALLELQVITGLKNDGERVGLFDKTIPSDVIATKSSVQLRKNGTIECKFFPEAKKWILFDNIYNWDEEHKILSEKLRMAEARQVEERRQREEEERRQREEERKEMERRRSNRRAQGLCQHCGGIFKGLFTKKCSSCGKEKDY